MMDAGVLWGMLTARGARTVIDVPGFGRLTPEHVLLALKDLPRGPMLMGMVFYAGDYQSIYELEMFLWCRIQERAAGCGWQYHKNAKGEPGKPFDRKLAELILIEIGQNEAFAAVSKPCYACAGIGYQIEHKLTMLCTVCKGLRSAKITQQERADYCGCSRWNWHRTWSGRYFAMYSMARDWHTEAGSQVKNRVNKFFNVA